MDEKQNLEIENLKAIYMDDISFASSNTPIEFSIKMKPFIDCNLKNEFKDS